MTGDPSGDGTVRYRTAVVRVGALIPEFRESGLLIFFADIAPEELHDMSVLHHPEVAGYQMQAPVPGDVLQIGAERFAVTAVGDVVPDNLLRLGHVSVKANGEQAAPLPGDVCVEARPLPLPEPGDIVQFVAASSVSSVEERS